MGIYVNKGNTGFRRAVQSKIYVDKTGLLEYTNEVLGTEQSCICVSRPRRFGKSITAGMIAAYYDKSCDSRELFGSYRIAKSDSYEKHLNKYTVIHLDITMFTTQEKVLSVTDCINEQVTDELREIYPDILSSEKHNLPYALAEINDRTGERFVIIIDEWDAIFRESRYDVDAQKEYVDLLRGLFKSEMSKRFVALAYLTGILPIKKYNSESALNNFDEFTMTSPAMLAEYVGFTEEEVRTLCKEYNMDFEEAARWYDGYSFQRVSHVYSPNSVVKAMLRGEYSNYWTSTVAYESLKGYISMNFDGLKDAVIQMLAGGRGRVRIDTYENDMTSFRNKDDVLTMLIHLGYLAYDSRRKEVYIPNEEVKEAFGQAVEATDWTNVIQAIRQSDRLLQATWDKDEEKVAAGIDAVHEANTSILKYNDENALSCVITLAYYNAANDYTLVREMPAGRGYADIVFLPRKYSDKPAMVVELKYDQSAEGAIRQIEEKNYAKALEEYKGNVLLVGINYDKETKKHSCVIREWGK